MNRSVIFSSAAGMLIGFTTAVLIASGGGVPCLQGNDCALGPGTTIGGLPAPFDAGGGGGGSFDAGMLSGLFLTDPMLNADQSWCGLSANSSTAYSCTNLPAPSASGSVGPLLETFGGKNYRMGAWNTGAGEFNVGVIQIGTGIVSPSIGGCFQTTWLTGSVLTNTRFWAGWTDTDLKTGDNPSTFNVCAFRFSSTASDTTFTAFTDNGTASSFRGFGPTVAINTLYLLTVCINMDPISFQQLAGPSCNFLIGDPKNPTAQTLIATTIPTSAQDMGAIGYVDELDNVGGGARTLFTPDKYTIRYPSIGQ